MSRRVGSTPPWTVPPPFRCSSVASRRKRAVPSWAVRSRTPRTAAKPAVLLSVTIAPYPRGGDHASEDRQARPGAQRASADQLDSGTFSYRTLEGVSPAGGWLL